MGEVGTVGRRGRSEPGSTAVPIEGARPSQPGEAARPRRRMNRVLVAVLALGVLAWGVLLWQVSLHVVGWIADDANAVLAGHAMAHGHVLLHGWELPCDPMWTVDLFAFISVFPGIKPLVLDLSWWAPA